MKAKVIAHTYDELSSIVGEAIKKKGPNCDLNFIDTSRVKDMSCLFKDHPEFNGDISNWDVSNATDMNCMFYGSKFNGDISQWDVSNVKTMEEMFKFSVFNGDISEWDVSNVTNMRMMFAHSEFNCAHGNISKWDVSKVNRIAYMFKDTDVPSKIIECFKNKIENKPGLNLDKDSTPRDIDDPTRGMMYMMPPGWRLGG